MSGTTRDSASASDTKPSLLVTQVRQDLAGVLLTLRASGAHQNTPETRAALPPGPLSSRIRFDPSTLSLEFQQVAPQRDAIAAGIPVKPNAYSGGKPNFIPGCSGRHRSVATLASRLCKKCSASSRETIRSEVQGACRKRGKGYRGKDGTACPRLSTQCPRSAKALRTSPITSALPTNQT